MTFGILKEESPNERRVALTPAGVQTLVAAGHTVYIQHEAGLQTLFPDEEYQKVGGVICYSAQEIINRGQVVLKISPPNDLELPLMSENQVLLSFLHLAVSNRKNIETLLTRKITSIAYELIEDVRGDLSVLQVMSEIAGQLCIQLAGNYLQAREGGRGILLGNIPGVAPASVVVLGAGTVGRTAARVALGLGAEVTVLDRDLSRLRDLHNSFPVKVNTATATDYNVEHAVQYADVVIGAVLLKGERTPHLVTEAMVKKMKVGSVIIDVSIDQGGCVETGRPTSIEEPVFTRHGVVHYCVPNMTAVVPRTASVSLTNALLPYVLELARHGVQKAFRLNPGLAVGVCTFNGSCTNEAVAKVFDLKPVRLPLLLNPHLETLRN
ncbi:MAG: alanine dehydrogenase [Ignavibacteriales bacterium]|nr:alanine dehydrogenase [Ignavibacteriales bacterium]